VRLKIHSDIARCHRWSDGLSATTIWSVHSGPSAASVSAGARAGGRQLDSRECIAGATELIESRPEPKRIVILEFADTASFKRWYDSPEYQKILPGRLDNSTGRAFVVEPRGH
jgi:uncharacterized protein (DUF1330 family)